MSGLKEAADVGAADFINSIVRAPRYIIPIDAGNMLNQLVADVFAHNVEAGWWTDLKTGQSLKGVRNCGELLCLVHSECSEGLDGLHLGLMDDKLPHRNMYEVEMADVLIRIFDICGGFDLNLGAAYVEIDTVNYPGSPYGKLLWLHRELSHAMEGHRKNKRLPYSVRTVLEMSLAKAVRRVMDIAHFHNFDLGGAYAEKCAFNAVRSDHKMENRIKEGGKAY